MLFDPAKKQRLNKYADDYNDYAYHSMDKPAGVAPYPAKGGVRKS